MPWPKGIALALASVAEDAAHADIDTAERMTAAGGDDVAEVGEGTEGEIKGERQVGREGRLEHLGSGGTTGTSDIVLHCGIIDILQEYNYSKVGRSAQTSGRAELQTPGEFNTPDSTPYLPLESRV